MVQLLTILLIFVSFVMTLAVPVACANPQDWEDNKGLIFTGGWAWSGLVIVTGLASFGR